MSKPKKPQPKIKFIVYKIDDEILVCTPAMEKRMLKEYFAADCGRNLDSYDREERRDVLTIQSRTVLRF